VKKKDVADRIAETVDLTWGYTSDSEKRLQSKLAVRIRREMRKAFRDGRRSAIIEERGDFEVSDLIAAKYGVKL